MLVLGDFGGGVQRACAQDREVDITGVKEM
jgi:hypothetical protein